MTTPKILALAEAAIRAVCPIDGLSAPDAPNNWIQYKPEATAEQRAEALALYQGLDWDAVPYTEKRAAEWAASPWNAAAQNSAMIKWFRGDASEMQALNAFDLDVRTKHPKPGA